MEIGSATVLATVLGTGSPTRTRSSEASFSVSLDYQKTTVKNKTVCWPAPTLIFPRIHVAFTLTVLVCPVRALVSRILPPHYVRNTVIGTTSTNLPGQRLGAPPPLLAIARCALCPAPRFGQHFEPVSQRGCCSATYPSQPCPQLPPRSKTCPAYQI